MHSSVSYYQTNIFINSHTKSVLKAPRNPPSVWSISLSIPNLGLVCSLLSCDVCSMLPFASYWERRTIESFCDYCEHDRFVLVSFVLKVSVNFRSVDRNIKLALDALKELEVFNSL